MYIIVFKQLVIMLVICVLSFGFSKRNKFSGRETSFLSRLLLYFVNPCLILNSFNMAYSREKLVQLLFVIVVCAVLHLLFTVIVLLTLNSHTEEGKALDGLERIGVVFTNCGFIGIPLINGVFGTGGVFYLMGYLAVFNIYLWMFGEYQMSRRFNLKKVLTNPNVLAVLAGIVLFCMPFTLPELISKPLGYISEMNTALSMTLLGMLFACFKKTGSVSYTKRVVWVALLRLVVSSLVSLALLYFIARLFPRLPNLREMLFVIYIASLCPIGMSVSTFACVFGKDASYAGLMVSVTSVCCIITVPAFVKLAELLLP